MDNLETKITNPLTKKGKSILASYLLEKVSENKQKKVIAESYFKKAMEEAIEKFLDTDYQNPKEIFLVDTSKIVYCKREGLGQSWQSPKELWRSFLDDYILSSGLFGIKKEGDSFIVEEPNTLRGLWMAEVRDLGLNTDILIEGKTYTIGTKKEGNTINPRKIKEAAIADYLWYCESVVDPSNPKEQKKLAFAKGVLRGDAFLPIYDNLGNLYKPTREKLKSGFGNKLKKGETPEHIQDPQERTLLEDVAQEELRILLRGKKIGKKNDSLELVLAKYKPEIYEENLNHTSFYMLDSITDFIAKIKSKIQGNTYEIEFTRDPVKVKKAAEATVLNDSGSCINHESLDTFARWTSDTGTLFLVGKQNGVLKGYARMYITKNEKEEPVLFVDTIEPPRKDFEEHKGFVNAMSLAAVQLGLDIGVKCVVGNDGRIKYGPKQAFGSTERKMTLEKVGRGDYQPYTFLDKKETTPYVLMQNWRG